MFCGNAAGELLPPYVVYKAEHLWSTWTENGPLGTRYNRSKSGWFDGTIFEDWFESLVVPRLRRVDGKKIIIGDNLSSHINPKVIKMCGDNNIEFICLPPNSTHLTQPLDVSFFAPMKKAWRSIMTDWKDSQRGSTSTTLQKDVFPSLLKTLLDKLDNKTTNLISGFKKCGLYPLNKDEIINRLPSQGIDQRVNESVGDAFISILNKKRIDLQPKVRARRKRVMISAGKSVTSEALREVVNVVADSSQKRNRKKRKESPDPINSETDESDSHISYDDSSEYTECDSDNSIGEVVENSLQKPIQSIIVGDYVIVQFENNKYPGIVTHIPENIQDGPTVKCMVGGKKAWKWPEKVDEIAYSWEEILEKIPPPVKISNRGHFSVPQLADFV